MGAGVDRRVATADEAMAWVLDRVSRLLAEHYPERPHGREMWMAVLALLPELHALGIHAEWSPDRSGIQFAAFQTVADLKEFWGHDGSDEEFEAMLRDVPNLNLITLRIDGVPTRCVEPFIAARVEEM